MDVTPSVDSADSLWCRRLPLILSLGYAAVGILYIFTSDRLLLWLLADAERLTAHQTLKGTGFVILTAVLLYAVTDYGVRRIRASERARTKSDEYFRRLVETTNEGVWILDASARTTFVNESMANLLDYTPAEMLGRPLAEFAAPECRRLVEEEMARRTKGERSQYECELQKRDGSSVWTIITSAPIIGDDGSFAGAFKMVTDITQQKMNERALQRSITDQRRLLNELDHRVRNNLSSVLGLLQLARTGAPGADALAESVSGRVKAMSRAYSLLSASGWAGQDLARLIGTLVPGQMRERVKLRGKDVKVPPHQTGALAIMMHELLSNALQHGALSNESGTVDIAWSINGGEAEQTARHMKLEIVWTERGGPPIEMEPTPRAGCRLIEGLVASDLRGKSQLKFLKAGAQHTFHVELIFPGDGQVEPPGSARSVAARN